MLDPITLDQLRTFVTVVEAGSFSAAARALQRVQSAVSTSMANLETQLEVSLWDRSTRIATLTDDGRALLVRAKRVLGEMDALRALAAEIAGGLEAQVSVCVDSLFPTDVLVAGCAAFTVEFPGVDLRVDVQTMSAVAETVLAGGAKLGIVTPLGVRGPLVSRALEARTRMVPVVAASHPLAERRPPLSEPQLASHVQIVLSERSAEGVPDQAVLSPRTWRVADLATKRAMLLQGLGWGNLPEHLVVPEVERGTLVRLRVRAWTEDQHTLVFHALHRPETALGPAHRWLLERLERGCRELEATERGD
jgi:DNA-binding transcriptional LysR family regulator